MVRGWMFAVLVAPASIWACGSFEAAPTAVDAGGTPTAEAGPVLLYTFAEGSGTSVRDVSGVEPALDLVIDDPTAAAWSPAGLALFAGGTRVSSVVNATKLEGACLANGFTAEAWVHPDGASYEGPARILTHSVDTTVTRFFIGAGRNTAAAGDRWVLRVGSTTGDVAVESVGPLTSALHHVVAVVRPSADATLYVDGETRAQVPLPGALVPTPAPFVLGGETGVDSRRFTGTYSRVAIHCRPFSAGEVRTAYAAGSGH